MGIAPFLCAMGDAPAVAIPAAATVDLAPADDSVDTNRVIITGSGDISSFGLACGGLVRADILDPEDEAATDDPITVSKRVEFQPDAGQTITLHHNPPAITLLTATNRTITTKAYAEFQSDEVGNWTEIAFAQASTTPTVQGAGLLDLVYYTSSQTITIPIGATRAWVRMWGGTGASGSISPATGAYSGGTGAGGYLEKFLTNLVAGHTLAFTRGSGGNLTGAPNATASILASGTQTIAALTANGSTGSQSGDGSTNTAGTDGGTATGGDINLKGQRGASSGVTGPNGGAPGGVSGLSRGADGSQFGGNAGVNGGLVIAWFN